nr:Chain B, peptide [Escherichia coli]3RRF_B Chain B, peptide [Escherichia coli]3RSF_B Chain B, Unknown peptide, probably from expression host [Escherichia coli BL21(DE3)]3RT7_B Chain B, Unknown peptide, probably from expression host [Escherichia coli BL21(DE3)]3RTA_B Chain B, Unknown peptide, probably from expression host [Escherichia coli BL21(DE3)]3RTD_B Chain B, Unknown peptide, probably from expression host [Escherichia coli]3RTG_B Chain B, Unknown peptide, probably from expression host 
AAWLFEA